MSGWSSMLAVEIRHDGPADAPGVHVTYEAQDGSLVTEQLSNMNPGEPDRPGLGGMASGRTVYPSTEFHTFRDSTRVRVEYQGPDPGADVHAGRRAASGPGVRPGDRHPRRAWLIGAVLVIEVARSAGQWESPSFGRGCFASRCGVPKPTVRSTG